jgi:hypothetical protein
MPSAAGAHDRLFRQTLLVLAAAAADRVTEPAALEPQAATGARGREELRLHEEGPHQGRPEEHEAEDEWGLHPASIGTDPPSDKIES